LDELAIWISWQFGLVGNLDELAIWMSWQFGLVGNLDELAIWMSWQFGLVGNLDELAISAICLADSSFSFSALHSKISWKVQLRCGFHVPCFAFALRIVNNYNGIVLEGRGCGVKFEDVLTT
jgi:hypothetical protein